MINKVILIGNLGQDPEVRNGQSGHTVTTFGMATSRRWKDAEGRRQKHTEWHQVVCFGRLAEVAGEYLAKGRQVFIEGRLQTQSWEDRNSGQTRYRTEIVCESLQMLGQRPGSEAAAEAGAEAPEPPQLEEPVEAAPAAKKKSRRRATKKKA